MPVLTRRRTIEKDERAADPGRGAWYADPFEKADERWWDGRQWTREVRSAGERTPPEPESTTPPEPESTTPPEPESTTPPEPATPPEPTEPAAATAVAEAAPATSVAAPSSISRSRLLIAAVAAVAAVAVLVAVLAAGGTGNKASSSHPAAGTHDPGGPAVSSALSKKTAQSVSCLTDLGSSPNLVSAIARNNGMVVPHLANGARVYAYSCSGPSGLNYVAFADSRANVVEYGQQQAAGGSSPASMP